MMNLYTFVTWALQPLVRWRLVRKARLEALYGEHIDERFGLYPDFVQDPSRPLIWIHAVSLGETRAAAILLKALRLVSPTLRLLLTHGTATGREEGAKLLEAADIQVWQPWDTSRATRLFFNHFKPDLGLLMETEIWPCLIASAKAAGIPVALVNARMSEKSLQNSQRWYAQSLASQAYHGLAAVYAQTPDDAARLTRLGAKVNGVFGNLKFDVTPNAAQAAAGHDFRLKHHKPIILFASSREGEEAQFLAALTALSQAQRTAAQWLIVPRHPQRFEEVEGLIEAAGFAVARRSQHADFDKHSSNGGASQDVLETVWLGDSIGEMSFYYSLATTALLGGSFAKLGGQNLIEALACGCQVVMGPHTFNFEEAAKLGVSAGVATQVGHISTAITHAMGLRELNRQTAIDFVQQHTGAADKTARHVISLIVR